MKDNDNEKANDEEDGLHENEGIENQSVVSDCDVDEDALEDALGVISKGVQPNAMKKHGKHWHLSRFINLEQTSKEMDERQC